MNKNSNEEIYYTLTYAEEIPRYFVEIQEEYYEITVENEKFKVNREATDTEIINRKPKITVIVDKENIVTATLGEEDNIVLTSKEEFGKAIITIKEENSGVEKTCEVKVKIPIEQITLKQDTINIEREGKIELSQLVTITPKDTPDPVTWTSEETNVATITPDEAGKNATINAIGEGTTKITITCGDKSIYCTVTVNTSILHEVARINQAGNYTVTVNRKNYKFHVYYYDGDTTRTSNKVFGDSNDVGSSTKDASNMVVVKVEGNLTINNGVTISPYTTSYGGPKGFLLYCTGTLTNNGIISNDCGAKAAGEDVYLWKNLNGSFETVPELGANGASSYTTSTNTYQIVYPNVSGAHGTGRQTAGGASGGAGGGSGGGSINIFYNNDAKGFSSSNFQVNNGQYSPIGTYNVGKIGTGTYVKLLSK